ncbi:ABC transporter substrate-binding protein (plasmid) [Embleya sp. NBC_00888]|uniref:ABC transporter substrate-binding protein n=1 Tax=Embleya sp. NBC_00888 TaxID=2975960 RepID=UPI002F9078B2|nr:ABC transporter substrate-binding protein [Embleya sp. NBC_00888]
MKIISSTSARRPVMVAAIVAIALIAGCGSPDNGGAASGSARGYDGKTVTVAGMGVKANMGSAEIGAKARIERFNAEKEIPGLTIDYTKFVDDQANPATSLSEARRLVTSDKVFAIVGDVSQTNPVQYFAQQKVPYFGIGLEPSYCADKPSTDLWGFGYSGCLTPPNPEKLPNAFGLLRAYATEKTGKKSPSIALFSYDVEAGRITTKYGGTELAGAGFDVVFSKAMVPPPPVSDYTPYIQQLLKSDGGSAPDVIQCYLGPDCVQIYALLKAGGFKGLYAHSLWSDALVKPMAGSLTPIAWANPNDSTPAADRMRADVRAVKSDQAIDIGVISGYFSASMFIDALKAVAEKGKDKITPEAVREEASKMTFEIKGLVGPTHYPEASAVATGCRSVLESDGTQWQTVMKFTCLDNTFHNK